MNFEPLRIAGAMLIRPELLRDHRGFFARTYCNEEYARHGLADRMVQSSISYNARRGTVRGMHLQWPPSQEAKTVRCLRGVLHDVLLDLRPESATYLQHQAVRLDDEARNAVYIPPGIAHGFQTLADDTEVLYMMSDVHAPHLAEGWRWNDPAFAIQWPLQQITISDRDAGYADFSRDGFESKLAEKRVAGGHA
jgi:dTDP-4-dehydrorhamnose 3,5-epimerase